MLDLMKTTIITILISLLGASAALATGDSDSEQSESEPKLVVQYKGSFEALDDNSSSHALCFRASKVSA